MKLMLVADDGTVIDDVEDVELYDLDKAYHVAVLLDEIKGMLRRAHKKGKL